MLNYFKIADRSSEIIFQDPEGKALMTKTEPQH